MFCSGRDLRKGWIVKKDNKFYQVTDFHHLTPGNWRAYMQTKLKDLTTGSISEHRFRADEKVELGDMENKNMQFLYAEPGGWVFMDNDNYEQYTIAEDIIGDAKFFMIENETYHIMMLEGAPAGINLSPSLILEVTFTEPGLKGDSSTNVMKPATLQTGLEIKVPLFIDIGQKVKVDTRTCEYVERA